MVKTSSNLVHGKYLDFPQMLLEPSLLLPREYVSNAYSSNKGINLNAV